MNKLIVLKTSLRRKMSCRKCLSVFSLFNWKIKCAECDDNYCSKCLMKQDGFLVCEVCSVLIKRPVNRNCLMELKSKDLQDYLNRHNVSTHGVVEKQELVEILCRSTVPVRPKKSNRKFPPIFGGSVPNLAARSQTYLNNLRSNAEAALNNHSRNAFRTANNASTQAQTNVGINLGHQSATNSPVHSPPPTQESHRNQPRTPTSTPTSPTQTAQARQTTSPTSPQSPTSPTASNTQQQQTTVDIEPAPAPDVTNDSVPVLQRRFAAISNYELEDLNGLSGKELKQLLTYNRVDFKGCVEKAELVERAERLWSDTQKMRDAEATNYNGDCCKICMDAPLDCVLLECGHIATCINCGKQLAECPICRQYVSRVVRTFKA